jgi:GntR family transcriptional repressor for pyruvate dehydrogenase complex
MVRFRPIERKPTVSAEIIDQLVTLIRNGELKPGDTLPSERELCSIFRVGRSTVREAIKELKGTGIIQQTTKGCKISDSSRGQDGQLWLFNAQATIRDVFEMRKIIDVEAAGLAAERSTQEDIKKIRTTLADTMEFQEMIASDISFHRAIVKSTHNEIIFRVYNSVTGMLFQVYNYYSFLPDEEEEKRDYLKEVYADHSAILKAIESRNARSARKSIKEHLDFVEKRLLKSASR